MTDRRYYIHFETMPDYKSLDSFWFRCTSHKKGFASSYFFTASPDYPVREVFEFARECFPRRPFVICNNFDAWKYDESDV